MKKISLVPVFPLFILVATAGCDQSTGYSSSSPSTHQIPAPLTEIKTDSRQVAASCPSGGMLVVHGLDHDGNGHLSPYEQLQAEVVCHASPLAPNDQRGVAMTETQRSLTADQL